MHIEERISLKKYSTFHIGGLAEFFTTAFSKEELREAILWARERGVVWRVIGEGSNILFSDSMVLGLTIRNVVRGIEEEVGATDIRITVGAGETWDALVVYTCEKGWWGLENLSRIPGTVGATPIQNVGAYGVEVADSIESVLVYDTDEDVFVALSKEECHFGYRHSLFREKEGMKYVVCSVVFVVPKESGPQCAYRDLALYFKDTKKELLTPRMVRDAVSEIRSKKFPDWNVYGTAGSFFKNPIIDAVLFETIKKDYPELSGYTMSDGRIKVPLGWILDHVCHLRGVQEGLVGTYEAQALVIVAQEGATAENILAFTQKIAECVKEKTNISIEHEVTHIK